VLTASCERLPGRPSQQDAYSGAGLINYNNARTIMQNQQYGIVLKEADSPDGGGAASFTLDTAPVGSNVTLRYVIPISGAYHASPSSLDLVHPSSFSTYTCVAFKLEQSSSMLTTLTEKNTGYVPLPTNNTIPTTYCVDLYIGENRNEGVTEYIQFAYLIS